MRYSRLALPAVVAAIAMEPVSAQLRATYPAAPVSAEQMAQFINERLPFNIGNTGVQVIRAQAQSGEIVVLAELPRAMAQRDVAQAVVAQLCSGQSIRESFVRGLKLRVDTRFNGNESMGVSVERCP